MFYGDSLNSNLMLISYLGVELVSREVSRLVSQPYSTIVKADQHQKTVDQ